LLANSGENLGNLARITQAAREMVQAVHSARELALKKASRRITA
jgi:hypothetical protein